MIFFLLLLVNVQAFVFYPLPWEDFIIIPILSLFLSIFAGVMSGLTVGLMGIDKLSLTALKNSGTPSEKIYAKRILSLLEDHHLLLVTLLLANAISLESLPIVLEILLGRLNACIVGVVLTLIFSEVIPLALCTSRFQVPIASAFANLVRFLMIVFWPFSYPLARMLDRLIGHSEGRSMTGEELKTMFLIHSSPESKLFTHSQVSLIHKAIDLKENILWEIFTPIHRIAFVYEDLQLTQENLIQIQDTGFTSLPVKNVKGAYVGIVNVKDLIFADREKTVKDYSCKSILLCNEFLSPYFVLSRFKINKTRIALITQEDSNHIVGLITQNDIFRYLIKTKKIIYRREMLDTNHNDESSESLSGRFSKKQTLSFEIEDLDQPITKSKDVLSYLDIE
jgi:CBS domain containing-hemolysin-like protein